MKIRTWYFLILVALVPVLATGTYVSGYRAAQHLCRDLNVQKASVLRVTEWSVGIRMLAAIREGQPDVVAQHEKWIADQLATVDVENVAEGSLERAALAETVKAVNAYRARYADSRIDPVKDPRLASVLAVRN